ncbi:MAG: hypothetical protein A2V67_17745 [Deltaproteobacteria bacterium RBG_13_61_14]|nr:MAG: hypothetical protein A2V67_17745 [Deltaproteobacteria bacterium RBG_13_61_14]
MKIKLFGIGAMVVLMLLSSPALAAKGIHLGLGAGIAFPVMNGDAIQDIKPQPGPAAEINAGYGFTEQIYAGLYYGMAAGWASEDWDENAQWGTGYLGLLGKYSLLKKSDYTPYLELGLHNSVFSTAGDNHVFVSDGAIGVLAGGGVDFFLGTRKRIMLSADLSYRSAQHSRGVVDLDPGPTVDVDFNADTDVVLLLFKLGYVWRPRPLPGY